METIDTRGFREMMITWSTVSLDELDSLKDELETLKEENAMLKSDGNDLVAAIMELAAIIGGDEEE